jgi:CheY-like chemotaxis protein
MDIQMLVMNGKEAMSSLLQLEIKTPVYALTADCTSSDVQRYAAIGFTGALGKPLALETLYSVTRQHLSVFDVEAGMTTQQAPLLIPSSKIRILFYKELAEHHLAMTKNIQNLDYAGLTKIVHIIMGSAGSFGYDDITNLAAQSLLLLKQKQYIHGVQHCIKLNRKLVRMLNEHNN